MCLFVDSKKVRVAKKNMVCYKVMVEYSGDNGRWMSPYQGMTYKEGHAYELGEQLQLLDGSKIIKRYSYMVEKRFHSFTNVSDALYFLNEFGARYPRPNPNRAPDASLYVIVKCVIPEGTEYVEGLFTDRYNTFPSFCSEKIICEGKIKNE